MKKCMCWFLSIIIFYIRFIALMSFCLVWKNCEILFCASAIFASLCLLGSISPLPPPQICRIQNIFKIKWRQTELYLKLYWKFPLRTKLRYTNMSLSTPVTIREGPFYIIGIWTFHNTAWMYANPYISFQTIPLLGLHTAAGGGSVFKKWHWSYLATMTLHMLMTYKFISINNSDFST